MSNVSVEMVDGKLWQFTEVHFAKTTGDEAAEDAACCGFPMNELAYNGLYFSGSEFDLPPLPGVKRKHHRIDVCVKCATVLYDEFRRRERRIDLRDMEIEVLVGELDQARASIEMLKRAVKRLHQKTKHTNMLEQLCTELEEVYRTQRGTLNLQTATIERLEKKIAKRKNAKKPKVEATTS